MTPITTLSPTQNRLSGPLKGGILARKRHFQRGSLFQRGKRNKVWVARWWEEIISSEGTVGRVRRSEILGKVSELRTRRQAEELMSLRMRQVNRGSYSVESARTLADFVDADWKPVMLPTMK